MNLDDDTQVIQQSRYGCPGDDVRVGHADHFRHDEGRSAHDGRQQLPANGSRGFYCAGKLFRVAGFFHQRDGECARGYHVGYSGTVNGT